MNGDQTLDLHQVASLIVLEIKTSTKIDFGPSFSLEN